MAVYHITIDRDTNVDAIMGSLKEHYSDYYEYHGVDGLIFLRTDDIAEQVAKNLGINGPDVSSTGTVFKLNADYSGFTQGGIWQWLRKENG